jgi:hypothetical protein
VRVPRSWIAPHRVKKNDKFYGRNSAGKYPLDVGELRVAFTLSESVAERIRDFRAERIARVYGRETPVPLPPDGCLVLHVVPLGAFTDPSVEVDMSAYFEGQPLLVPPGASSFSRIYNLDGVVNVTGPNEDGTSDSYVQLFRMGVAEYVAIISFCRDGTKYVRMGYEQCVIDALKNYLGVASGLGIETPFYLFLSFVGVRGHQLGMDRHASWRWGERARPLREDTILLPEVFLEDPTTDPQRALRPLFNRVANAFGLPRSPTQAKD